jgi:hypothetical protein
MSAAATSGIPADGASSCQLCSPELAQSALQHMKGCTAAVEGIDDCGIAFLTSLDVSTVERLVRAWDAAWGFPTASRLAALRDRLGNGHGLPVARRGRKAA